MTDLEISKALALAIGYDEANMAVGELSVYVDTANGAHAFSRFYKRFDYRDWNVIGPIAEKYECFPDRYIDDNGEMWWDISHIRKKIYARADTPQKAIALAVIGAAPKDQNTPA